ncbi:NAD-dependent epimerase/dehydratase family protein [Ammoniphilus sp. 3BR4]|uniref:NAD-dependent epimerase/dehydratase family protein n=1 Tax=Ammoniphilus sp. 3BR4 TaxID=3158265 RepID=UPI0034655B64
MRILITGGAGFIGSHLVEAVAQQGHNVTVIDDLSTGKRSFVARAEKQFDISFVQGSVLDRALLKELIDDTDLIFHMAAVLGVKNTVENPLKIIEGNIDGTRNVLELASSRNAKVIFASTSEVYGKNDQLPFTEESSRVLGPTTTHRWCYAAAKALDEHMCFAYADKGLPVTVIRYFNIFGSRAIATHYGGVIPNFISAAISGNPIRVFGTGEQTRCFTFISDAIKGTAACMDRKFDGHAFNIGTEQEISINKLAEKIKKLTGSSSEIIHIPYEEAYGKGYEDTPNRVPDLSKARTLLQYQPSVGIDEGLRHTIEWFRNEADGGPAEG